LARGIDIIGLNHLPVVEKKVTTPTGIQFAVDDDDDVDDRIGL